ncbi:NAD-dependent epimerase/dehydratase family protein [Algoriphagus formosus]|uniref:NAD-dependent epimerase/dehydratase family protein n=1 Tax=Algoriphagus formosus TaxID=2007308 RepID=A0A4R5URV3_9BACT|nr:NAD-dependent epimerase/dehydratase family protein [Algoriphagus aquimaris]TDK41818.1 NAD-dependent epimerase/dehydratase family protein [Algoriphagus aquimaris]
MKKALILGANGNIGQIIAKELADKGVPIKLFSRNPKKVNPNDELISGNLLHADDVLKAAEGVDVVFLVAGIQYDKKIWEKEWPIIMENTLEACKAQQAKLVFFDNMYACDPTKIGNLTESTALNPESTKGKVRLHILKMLWREVEEKSLEAIVARAPDFYGPIAKNSLLHELVISRMKSGKNPQWLYNAKSKHSFIYIPDAGKATVELALSPNTWNQTWNLPTDQAFYSVEKITQILNTHLKKDFKLQVLPSWAISLLGLFIQPLREVKELSYQLEEDYCFDSSKFEKAFGWKATPMEDGLKKCLES